jgi:hypothetical protein
MERTLEPEFNTGAFAIHVLVLLTMYIMDVDCRQIYRLSLPMMCIKITRAMNKREHTRTVVGPLQARHQKLMMIEGP